MTTPTPTDAVLPLQRLAELHIAHGAHPDRSNGLCALEVVSWLAGEPHSDHPACVSPVSAAFCRRWNDDLPDDAARDRLLKPLLPLLLNTRSTEATEAQRAWAVTDWLVRTHTPAWFDLVDGLQGHGQTLRALAPLTDRASARAGQPAITAARDAAGDAARAAAGDAARAAARDAARAAARAALQPTVDQLQRSACDLIRTLCAMTTLPERRG